MDVKTKKGKEQQQNKQKARRDTIPQEVYQEASRITRNLFRLPAKPRK